MTKRVEVNGAVPMYGATDALRSVEASAVRFISPLNAPTPLTVTVNDDESLWYTVCDEGLTLIVKPDA